MIKANLRSTATMLRRHFVPEKKESATTMMMMMMHVPLLS
jgi:hypothetical protein